MTKQLTFGFVKEIDQELAEKAEQDRLDSKKANADAHLKWCVEEYPPENEEWDIMLIGIRLSRFVHGSECEKCSLGCFNHCPSCLGTHWSDRYKQYCPIKVCLKDFLAKCKEWGYEYDHTKYY